MSRHTCDELGVCNASGDCPGCPKPAPGDDYAQAAQHQAHGGGNVWFAEPEPPEPLTLREVALAFIWLAVCSAAGVAALGFASGLLTGWLQS